MSQSEEKNPEQLCTGQKCTKRAKDIKRSEVGLCWRLSFPALINLADMSGRTVWGPVHGKHVLQKSPKKGFVMIPLISEAN